MENEYEFHLRNHTQDGLEKRWISQKVGYGVFATKNFNKSEFVTEYRGELISSDVAKQRFNNYPAELGSYMFELGRFHGNKWIDATYEKNCIGRFVNHAKNTANCKVILKYLDKTPRIFLIAIENISSGSQILYDYYDKNDNFEFLDT